MHPYKQSMLIAFNSVTILQFQTMNYQTYLSLLLFILSSFSCVTGCHDNEREALLSFKSLLRDPSNRLASWQGRNCCNWRGIHCSNHSLHITAINLRNPNPNSLIRNIYSKVVSTSNTTTYTAIEGNISPSLFTLSHLRYLDLSFNNFLFSNIPTGLSNLTRLTHLKLSSAMFQGAITTQLENLTSLQQLDLSCSLNIADASTISINLTTLRVNRVGSSSTYISAGTISSSNLNWLRGLYNLRELRLTGVDLSEASRLTSWAEPFSMLSQLRLIHLSSCKITGRIPIYKLLNLTYLSSLNLDYNFFNSLIPNQLQNLTSLSNLDLSGSYLQGTVPYLPQVHTLYVGANDNVTVDLRSMFEVPWPHLEKLDIQMTQVTGPLPTSFANTSSLIYFQADGCSIDGPIPSSLYNLSNLEILFLNYNSLTGHLSQSISNLKRLQYISLFQNFLEGPIPDSVCKILPLQYINLAGNSITGSVPDCIRELTNLTVLSISINNMSGTVPSLLSLFQNANPNIISLGSSGLTVKVIQYPFTQTFQPVVLELSSCNIGGQVPDFIAYLTNLEFLNLANNNLSGAIPPWLFTLPMLGYLDLSHNNLQGLVPPIGQLRSSFWPATLNLGSNHLEGPIPQLPDTIEEVDLSWNNFTGDLSTQPGGGLQNNIKSLTFAGNQLTGPIPLSFCNANNVLMQLDLSNNRLSGRVPMSLTNCTSLIFLNLGKNSLTGNLPLGLKAMKNITYLQLNGNHFNGPFPSFIEEIRNLEVLNLGNNIFEGEIPQFIGDLQSLRILVLEFNSFNGSLPREIGNLGSLQYIDLSNNKLLGDIPKRLHGWKMLKKRPERSLFVSVTGFMYFGVELTIVKKGHSYELEAVFTDITGMDFSCNSFTGNIPQEIGLLEGLNTLNLSHNHLSGEIPMNMGGMLALESLDLSFNQLSGEIPMTLTSLNFLAVLKLSYNNLSGNIPKGSHFDTFYGDDGSAYVGNKFLCGAPDGPICNINNNDSSSPEIEDVEDEKHELLLYAIVICGYGVGLWGFYLVLYLMNEKWRKRYWSTVDWIVLRTTQCM